MTFRSFAAAAGLALTALLPTGASAGILDYTGNANAVYQIAYYGPVGQSFTAIDNQLLSIGFNYTASNVGSAVAPLTISLYSGAGMAGDLVASRTFTLTNPNGVFDTDFAGTALTIGSTYTAYLTTTTAYQGVRVGVNRYTGGQMYSPRLANNGNGGLDTAFRVVGVTAAVPEPATWGMMIVGFGAVCAMTRRKRKSSALEA